MNILFCVPEKITPKLGKPKVYMEISAALQGLGCSCNLVGIDEIAPEIDKYIQHSEADKYYRKRLRQYIKKNGSSYDVIEYEYTYLPYRRSEFPSNTLMVARSVLLLHHQMNISLPVFKGLPFLIRNSLEYFKDIKSKNNQITLHDYRDICKIHVGTALRHTLVSNKIDQKIEYGSTTMEEADLVMVSNEFDKEILTAHGISSKKIYTLPFGLSTERYHELSTASVGAYDPPVIAFVGTWDFRKGGATDIPKIAEKIIKNHPLVKFRFLGTKGLFSTKNEVLAHFRPSIQANIEVIPEFEPAELPGYLKDATLGIFPSYYEGFGFGILEMLASGLPVFAYHVPGPPEMLSEEYLVPSGQWKLLAQKVISLLKDPAEMISRRQWALSRAAEFNWDKIAQKTLTLYEKKIIEIRDFNSKII